MKRLVLCLAVTLGLCLGLGASARAVPGAHTVAATTAAPRAQTDVDATTRTEEVRAVERLAPYFDVDTATLDAAGALDAGVDAEVVGDFQFGLSWGRAQRTESLSLAAEGAAVQAVRCAGRTAFYRTFAYIEIWMNTCDVKRLTGIMTSGGGSVALAGAIISFTGIGVPIGAVIGIAGGLIAIGSGALTTCDSRSRGVILDNVGWPCRSQR